MSKRSKALFEPDYRYRGWNDIKHTSRRAFKTATVASSIIALILMWIGIVSTNYMCLGVCFMMAVAAMIWFPYRTRRKLDRLVVARFNPDIPPISAIRSRFDDDFKTVPNVVYDDEFDLRPIRVSRDPKQFEHQVADVFEKLYKVEGMPLRAEVVGGAGDGGIDIRLFDSTGTLAGIVQAKRHDPSKTLNPGYLRDLDSCRRRTGVRRAFLVTTARFSSETRTLAEECRIDLIDGEAFNQLLSKASGQPQRPTAPSDPAPIDRPVAPPNRTLPKIINYRPRPPILMSKPIPPDIEDQLNERIRRLKGE